MRSILTNLNAHCTLVIENIEITYGFTEHGVVAEDQKASKL